MARYKLGKTLEKVNDEQFIKIRIKSVLTKGYKTSNEVSKLTGIRRETIAYYLEKMHSNKEIMLFLHGKVKSYGFKRS